MTIRLAILEKLGLYRPIDHDHKRFERLAKWCESPIEHAFWSAGYFELSKHGRLTPQVRAGRYYLDFALKAPTFKLAIETDGHDYHNTPEQKDADDQRDRDLQSCGWRTIRFSGSKVYKNASWCVLETVRVIRGIR